MKRIDDKKANFDRTKFSCFSPISQKRGMSGVIMILIALAIGLVVLVVMIMGFTTGWKDFFGRITSYGGGDDVSSVTQTCSLASSTDDNLKLTSVVRSVKNLPDADLDRLVKKTSAENQPKFGKEEIKTNDRKITITKDKTVKGTCEALKEAGVISYS